MASVFVKHLDPLSVIHLLHGIPRRVLTVPFMCVQDTIGGKLTYKGRVDLDNCQIADLTDSSGDHLYTA